MKKNEAYYQHLAKCYLDNTCTPQQVSELFDYLQTDTSNKFLLAQLKDSFNKAYSAANTKSAAWSDEMQQDIINKISEPTKVIPLYTRWVFKIAAAVVVVFLSIAVIKYTRYNSTKNSQIAENKISNNHLLPGGNKATLTLADGKTITLDDAQNGQIANEGSTNIVKLQSGSVAYQKSSNVNAIATINTLATPRGGQYQIELPDGTKVWLNASSSLKYPTFFSGNSRVVELNGEAYFEVAKNKDMPFRVKMSAMDVNVLGTHFNVSAYNDESTIKTTLLEGSVKVTTSNSAKQIIPGEQAVLTANGKLSVLDADTDEAIAWKNGYFQFTSVDIHTVVKQISRWYDVEINYDKTISEHFTGTIPRSVEANEIFKMLKSTGTIKVDIKNKQVLITKL